MAETSPTDMHTIYIDALASFAGIFDRNFMDEPEMEFDVRSMWRTLRDESDDRYPDIESADIREAIREAASELRIPTEWTDD